MPVQSDDNMGGKFPCFVHMIFVALMKRVILGYNPGYIHVFASYDKALSILPLITVFFK